jgi:hypothetical protein
MYSVTCSEKEKNAFLGLFPRFLPDWKLENLYINRYSLERSITKPFELDLTD